MLAHRKITLIYYLKAGCHNPILPLFITSAGSMSEALDLWQECLIYAENIGPGWVKEFSRIILQIDHLC
jgi:hypothetical protein